MHLLPSFGKTADVIRRDGFEIDDEIYMALDGYNPFTMAKSMGILQMSLTDVVKRLKSDWLVLAGDRAETLVGAIVGAYTYTPTAHIQAGELSGNIDGQARHAIAKLVHMHFAANADAVQRLLRMGEERHRVHQVGAPQLDELVQGAYSEADEIEEELGFAVDQDYLLVVQHPVTEEFGNAARQTEALYSALASFAVPKVVIEPNNDAGGLAVKETATRLRKGDTQMFPNLERRVFLGLLRRATCIVGNSSAGLIEAPTFCVPAVNIGRRQDGRVRGQNVLDVSAFGEREIVQAIQKAMGIEFRRCLQGMQNPYGDGESAARILETLRRTPRDDRLLVKQVTY